MNPLTGILLIALGSIGAASFYVPFKKVKSWAWESYWISQGVAAWLIAPLLFAFIFVPKGELFPIINEAPSSAKLMAMFFGALWGFGGLTFGLSIRYLEVALEQSIALGLCAAFGTLIPPILAGDKLSSILHFVDEILLHLTRGVRWDSDHVLTFNDELLLITQEIVRSKALNRVNVGLDFFDASLNRIGAYVIGTRSAQLAFMYALLEPFKTLVKFEEEGKNFERLAFLELLKTKPFGAVYDYYCMKNKVPVGQDYIKEIMKYEKEVLLKR